MSKNTTFKELLNLVDKQEKTAAAANSEQAKLAAEINSMSDAELLKIAEAIEAQETEECIELHKEAYAGGQIMARAYVERFLELANGK